MANKQQGFTLIEIMIALLIFAIIATITTAVLSSTINSASVTQRYAKNTEQLNIALSLFSSDITQTIDRPITDKNGMQEVSLKGNLDNITFTHTGAVNPLSQYKRSTLQRVKYSLRNHQLIRTTWPVLDQVSTTKPSNRVLLDNVESIRFGYFYQQDNRPGVFKTNWPLVRQSQSNLPKAVRITITLKKQGTISQVFNISATNFGAVL